MIDIHEIPVGKVVTLAMIAACYLRRLLSVSLTAALLLPVARAAAENFDDIGGEKFTGVKLSGSVVRVRSGAIEVNTGDKAPLTVLAAQEALNAAFAKHKDKTKRDIVLKCDVIGTADFSFLRKDHGVSFTAELDKQRVGLADVTELSVFTVDDPGTLTLIDTQTALDEGKSAPAKEGYFQVNGQINQLRKDGFTVKTMAEQGKKSIPVSVKVRVAADAKVSLKVADYMLAKPGDSIEIEGFTFTKNKTEVPKTVLAEIITIKLSKPVGPPEKPKPAVARTERRAEKKPAAEDNDEAPTTTQQAIAAPLSAKDDSEEAAIDPADPLPGKLIFRDQLSVDGKKVASEPAGAKPSAGMLPAAESADAESPEPAATRTSEENTDESREVK